MIHHPAPPPVRSLSAHPAPDLVTVVVSPAIARALADAWEFTHAGAPEWAERRPGYLNDVANLRRAAAAAEANPHRRVDVGFLQTPGEVAAAGGGSATTPGPQLQLVRGEGQ